ncbi:Uncharacterised protein [Mycobacteroides abscessus subsp. abscessus]|nr:Uncharacterised protein [Mycobacteroides abscessus subsp. abscessus]
MCDGRVGNACTARNDKLARVRVRAPDDDLAVECAQIPAFLGDGRGVELSEPQPDHRPEEHPEGGIDLGGAGQRSDRDAHRCHVRS